MQTEKQVTGLSGYADSVRRHDPDGQEEAQACPVPPMPFLSEINTTHSFCWFPTHPQHQTDPHPEFLVARLAAPRSCQSGQHRFGNYDGRRRVVCKPTELTTVGELKFTDHNEGQQRIAGPRRSACVLVSASYIDPCVADSLAGGRIITT